MACLFSIYFVKTDYTAILFDTTKFPPHYAVCCTAGQMRTIRADWKYFIFLPYS